MKTAWIFIIFLTAKSTNTEKNHSIWLLLAKTFSICSNRGENIQDCFKERAIIGLEALTISKNSINLVPNSIQLINNGRTFPNIRSGKSFLKELEEENPSNRSSILNSVLDESFRRFIESRSILFSIFPEENQDENGRGKKDKGNGMLMMVGTMLGGVALIGKLGALAMISGKALVTSLLAFMLAALAAIKKPSGHHGSHGATYEVINVPPAASHLTHRRRSVDAIVDESNVRQTWNNIID